MGIPWDGTGINCYVMWWDRQICPMDNPASCPWTTASVQFSWL